jgi:hypothetical protein
LGIEYYSTPSSPPLDTHLIRNSGICRSPMGIHARAIRGAALTSPFIRRGVASFHG